MTTPEHRTHRRLAALKRAWLESRRRRLIPEAWIRYLARELLEEGRTPGRVAVFLLAWVGVQSGLLGAAYLMEPLHAASGPLPMLHLSPRPRLILWGVEVFILLGGCLPPIVRARPRHRAGLPLAAVSLVTGVAVLLALHHIYSWVLVIYDWVEGRAFIHGVKVAMHWLPLAIGLLLVTMAYELVLRQRRMPGRPAVLLLAWVGAQSTLLGAAYLIAPLRAASGPLPMLYLSPWPRLILWAVEALILVGGFLLSRAPRGRAGLPLAAFSLVAGVAVLLELHHIYGWGLVVRHSSWWEDDVDVDWVEVRAARAGEYLLKAQGDDDLVVWVNGREAVTIDEEGPPIRTAREVRVRLEEGRNRVLLRLNQRTGQWQASVRFRTVDERVAPVVGIPFDEQDVEP